MNQKDFLYVLKLVFITAISTFVIDKVIYFSIKKMADKTFTGQKVGKLNQFLTLKDSVDFIVLGSSRANHSVDPKFISSNSFNIGTDGTSIVYSTILTEFLSDKPQSLLIQIDPENFYSASYDGKDVEYLNMYYNNNAIVKKETDKLGYDNPFQKFFWSISYNSKLVSIFNFYFRPAYKLENYDGYDPLTISPEEKVTVANALKEPSKEICLEKFIPNKIYSEYLYKLIDLAKKNNKRVVFFTAPQDNDPCPLDNQHLIKLMAEQGIEYHDYSDFFKNDNSVDYWKDKIHLSKIGAEKFSSEIKTIFNK